jgi:hypothetical protein
VNSIETLKVFVANGALLFVINSQIPSMSYLTSLDYLVVARCSSLSSSLHPLATNLGGIVDDDAFSVGH